MGVSLKDLIEYEGYIEEALAELKAIKRAKAGDQVMVPAIRTRLGKRLVEIPAHPVNVLE